MDAKLTEREWREFYLPAFKGSAEAGVTGFMCSYGTRLGKINPKCECFPLIPPVCCLRARTMHPHGSYAETRK